MNKQSFTEDDFLKEIPQEELKEEIANIIDKYGTSRIMTRTARLLIAEKIVEFIEHNEMNYEISEIIRRSSHEYLMAYQEGYEQAKLDVLDMLKKKKALYESSEISSNEELK